MLFIAAPACEMVAEGCAAVLDTLVSDRGQDGLRAPMSKLTVRAAYPPVGKLLDVSQFQMLQEKFEACSVTMTTKISGTRDRVLTVHGPVQQAVSIFRDVVHGVPHDAYARMEPDYGSACCPPDRSKDRKLHRAAQTRKRRANSWSKRWNALARKG